jgi:hypothetical protein
MFLNPTIKKSIRWLQVRLKTFCAQVIRLFNIKIVLFEHQNIDNICDTVYVYFYLWQQFFVVQTYFLITRKINKNKKENSKLSHHLPLHFRGVCKKNIIQLWRRSNSNFEWVNIRSTTFGQPIGTFVPFSEDMSKEDHSRKRSELSNNWE